MRFLEATGALRSARRRVSNPRPKHPRAALGAICDFVQENTVPPPPSMLLLSRFQRAAPFPRLRVPLPLVSSRVCAGFPSPADGHLEGEFDLNELLIANPASTFLIRAQGESMAGKQAPQIDHGDLLVVDRAAEAHDGSTPGREASG